LILGGILSVVVVGLPIGAICFRLRGIFFAFATLVSSEIVRLIVLNTEFTLGGLGVIIPVAPKVQLGGLLIDFRSKIPYYYMALVLMLVIFFLTHLMVKSSIGFKLLTIREDEDAAISVGVNSFKLKLFAMVMSSFFAGVAGALYAQYISYIDPSSEAGGVLATATGLDVIITGVLGGRGTIMGPLIGSLIRHPLGEFLRVSFGFSAGLDLLTFGVVLVIVILLCPGGIWKYFSEKISRRRVTPIVPSG
jgi:branched-chain amino acid transport system permease protein